MCLMEIKQAYILCLIKSDENDGHDNVVENNTKTTMLTWSTLFLQELSCKCNTGEVTLASLR